MVNCNCPTVNSGRKFKYRDLWHAGAGSKRIAFAECADCIKEKAAREQAARKNAPSGGGRGNAAKGGVAGGAGVVKRPVRQR